MTSQPWPPPRPIPDLGKLESHVPGEPYSFIRLVNLLLHRRRIILVATMLTLFTTVAFTLVTPRTYSSSVAFVAHESNQTLADLTGLVGAPRFLLPAIASRSAAFYADLVNSDELLRQTVLTEYAFIDEPRQRAESSSLRGSLIDYFEMEADDDEVATEKAVARLQDHIAVRTDRETGVVRYTVTTEVPELSRQIAERIFTLINEVDLRRRQSQATAERRFIEARLDSARVDLRATEDRLERFLAGNRNFGGSPSLVFQHDRLQRDVRFKQQVLASLAEALEGARIEEVRNTPLLTVVDRPRAPRLPDPRHLLLKALVAVAAGITIGVVAALWMEFLARSRIVEPEAYEEFVSLKRDTFGRVHRLLPGQRRQPIASD